MKHTEDFFDFARATIVDYYKQQGLSITEYDVFIVWYCKTLQNFKAIASTTRTDERLFEVTWNGDKNEGYLDTYIKAQNTVYKTEDIWGQKK